MKERNLADLARTILKDPSVKVTFGGTDSYFTHETRSGKKSVHINIARMDSTPTGIMIMCGLVFHEIGHIHTDGIKSSGMLGDMENIIEDVRVDTLTITQRPGTAFDLEAITNYYCTKGSLDPQSLPDALRGKVLAYGYGRILKQSAILPLEAVCDEFIDDAFGSSFIADIEGILQGITTLKSFTDAKIMAKELVDLLVQQQQQQQQNQQNSPQSQNQPQAGGTESGQQDQPQNSNNQQDDQQGSDETGEADSQQDGTAGDQNPAEDDAPASSPSDQDSGKEEPEQDAPSSAPGGTIGAGAGSGKTKMPTPEEIEEMLNESSEYGDLGQLMKDELDEIASHTPASPGTPEWPLIGRLTKKYKPLDEAGCMVASSRMRSRLGSLLFSSKRLPISHGSSGRKLNTNRLVRMLTTGEPKVFQRKVEEVAPNSAVVVINDTSGSMENNGRWITANQAAFALHACLYSLQGVSCASLEFSGKDRDDGSHADVNMVCNFGEKPKSDAFNVIPFAGTPTDQAIWAARGLLLQRPEPRKILLVVTDGDPNDWDLTDSATSRTMRDGIEIAAIGVQSDAVKRFWKNNRVISTVADLPAAMFGMMEELLTRRV